MPRLQHILDRPAPHNHVVQLYTDEQSLATNVGRYLWEGLKQGDSQVVIASAEHRASFCRELELRGADVPRAESEGKLLLLDAREVLAQFMLDGQPDWVRFEKALLAVVSKLHPDEGRRIRAYGEMVGILWTAGDFSAAIRLEEYWNKFIAAVGLSLFCAYQFDVFSAEFRISGVDALLCDHTHLIPTSAGPELEDAIDMAMDDVLGPGAAELRLLIRADHRPAWGAVPRAEGMILWLRGNLPEQAEAIIGQARKRYRESQLALCA